MDQYEIRASTRRLARLTLVLVLVMVATYLVPRLITGGVRYYRLPNASQLSGVISQSIGPDQAGNLPQEGKDFTIIGNRYFDEGTWAFTTLKTTSSGNGFVILKKQDGNYRVVLGPGTAFDKASTVSMPSDLANYLEQKGILYESR